MYITTAAGVAPYEPTKLINTETGAYLSDGGVWTNNSDRDRKENIRSLSNNSTLEKLSRLDITEWNYITEGDSVTHIGPMAQDFYKLFGLGKDNRSISTIDASGVALAAIKELNKKTDEIDLLKNRVD
ncbi:MAG: tail fiber domain-containing protein, partial [candidate division Zixibacteria bacterium]|nr:tail fiber domain-containing protein [candidate division Zixibacteria bacterium]